MRRQRVRAFTLVEVVIAIIGTLVALLLPAVQRARESSRRSSCLNNVKQLALATLEYENRFRRLPGLFDEMPIQHRVSNSGERFTTWAVLLLPDMERQAIFDEYAKGESLPKFYVESYLCPSDSGKSRSGDSCSYVANAGWGVSAKYQKPSNGPFLNRIYDPKAFVTEGQWKDGREHTLAFSENAYAAGYDIMGWDGLTSSPNDTSKDPIDRDIVDKDARDRAWSPVFVWHSVPSKLDYINSEFAKCSAPDYPPCVTVNETGRFVGSNCTNKCDLEERSPNAKPSSEHGGGVNTAFGSGRAVFLRDTIDYDVFRALMTLAEKYSDSPNRDIVLDDQSYN